MNILDCITFKEMLTSAANNLENNYEEIDKLNVFPVPDGDTGTNMKMTFVSGVNDTASYLNDYIGDTAKYLSKRMLMGARGNSGVILSQIFKGFANSITGLQSINVEQFSAALLNGSKVAYKAVMRPVEGTILTVAREVAEAAESYYSENSGCSFEQLFDHIIKKGDESLNNTPELLPVLKEVGVVDSGGSGYMCILKGMHAYLQGNPIQLVQKSNENQNSEGYCVEITVYLDDFYKKEFNIDRLNKSLGRSCNEIKIKRVDNEVLLHAHTLTPGDIVNTAQRFGTMSFIKIQNLSQQHHDELNFDTEVQEKSKYAIITVCNGDGIKQQFNKYGVQYIINGGQTMNPATEDFVKVISKINAENIIILPNNSNIILAANQAKDIIENKNIAVLPTKSIPQGLTACINFNIEETLENNISNMQEAIENITSASITKAIKDTTYNKLEIKKDDYMGIAEKEIVTCGKQLDEVAKKLIDNLCDEDSSYMTIIYGTNISEQQAQQLLDYAVEKYDIEGEIINGKQELYQFIIGLE